MVDGARVRFGQTVVYGSTYGTLPSGCALGTARFTQSYGENMMNRLWLPRILVAFDVPSAQEAIILANTLEGTGCGVKVGKELFTRAGPDLVRWLVRTGFPVFLDLKYHDIPNTVAAACRAAAELGVSMLNVHASGGAAMLTAARNALHDYGDDRPLLIAVTVLTSLDRAALTDIGVLAGPSDHVLTLATLAEDCGLDGVVCSPQEAEMLRAQLGPDFVLVTPGVRPAGAAVNDQKRVMTPSEALRAGANHLVIGRPITAAPNPDVALAQIDDEVRHALEVRHG